MSPCLFNLYTEDIMWNAGLDEAEVNVFWNSLVFYMIQKTPTIQSLAPLPFLNPACTSGSSRFTFCWGLALRILSITLLACEKRAIVHWFEHSLALSFFGIAMKTDLFQFCGHCWVFQICWHIDCDTLIASSLSIWHSSDTSFAHTNAS